MGALYDSGLDENDPIIQPRKEPEVGSVVTYRLPSSARPTDPNRLWRGKALACYTGGVLVELSEPGYEKLCEYVQTANIVRVE